jgi:hypothetical protein
MKIEFQLRDDRSLILEESNRSLEQKIIES